MEPSRWLVRQAAKMNVCGVLIVIAIVCCSGQGGKLPDDFPVCKRNDPKLNECMKAAIQESLPKMKNGIPSLKVAELLPLRIPGATIGEGNGPVNVKQKFKDLKVYGLTEFSVEKADVSFTDEKFAMDIEAITPEFRFEADYELNGRILLLPIVGEGKCNVTARDVAAQLKISGEHYFKNEKEYIKVTDCKATLNPEKVEFKFDNLFNGDEALGKQINTLLNENWKDIYSDVKPGYEELICTVVSNYCNSVFSKVKLDDLFPK